VRSLLVIVLLATIGCRAAPATPTLTHGDGGGDAGSAPAVVTPNGDSASTHPDLAEAPLAASDWSPATPPPPDYAANYKRALVLWAHKQFADGIRLLAAHGDLELPGTECLEAQLLCQLAEHEVRLGRPRDALDRLDRTARRWPRCFCSDLGPAGDSWTMPLPVLAFLARLSYAPTSQRLDEVLSFIDRRSSLAKVEGASGHDAEMLAIIQAELPSARFESFCKRALRGRPDPEARPEILLHLACSQSERGAARLAVQTILAEVPRLEAATKNEDLAWYSPSLDAVACALAWAKKSGDAALVDAIRRAAKTEQKRALREARRTDEDANFTDEEADFDAPPAELICDCSWHREHFLDAYSYPRPAR
jgi:hypothetical protein